MTVLRRVNWLDTSRSRPSSSYDSTSIERSASWSKVATQRSLRDGAFALDPAADDVDDVGALFFREFTPLRDVVVALEAAAAAGGGGVLGDEHGVAAVRGLLAVLVRLGGSELLGDEIVRVGSDGVHAAQLDGRAVAGVEVELLAEPL